MNSKKAHKWISSRATSIQFNVPNGCLPKHFSIQNPHAVLVGAIRALCPEHTISLHDSFHRPQVTTFCSRLSPTLTFQRAIVQTFFFFLLTVHLSIFILVINQPDAQNLFYNKFISCLYMFRAPCAHRQEVKMLLYSLWYHHTYRWPSRARDGHLQSVMTPEAV